MRKELHDITLARQTYQSSTPMDVDAVFPYKGGKKGGVKGGGKSNPKGGKLSTNQNANSTTSGWVEGYVPKATYDRLKKRYDDALGKGKASDQRPPPAGAQKGSPKGGKGKSNQKTQGSTCENCGKANHTKAQCWRPGGGAAQRNNESEDVPYDDLPYSYTLGLSLIHI